jgi:hypothetical protein
MQAMRWKTHYSAQLRALREVCGVGVAKEGKSDNDFVVAVLLNTEETPALRQQIAAILQDIPFKIIVTGPFKLLPAEHIPNSR